MSFLRDYVTTRERFWKRLGKDVRLKNKNICKQTWVPHCEHEAVLGIVASVIKYVIQEQVVDVAYKSDKHIWRTLFHQFTLQNE